MTISANYMVCKWYDIYLWAKIELMGNHTIVELLFDNSGTIVCI